MRRKPRKAATRVVALILAAGESRKLKQPHALTRFRGKAAVERAIETCGGAGFAAPVVVLGCEAKRVPRAIAARAVINRGWRAGMMSSIRAGLRRVPRNAAVLLYPVDYPLLTPAILRRLMRAFRIRARRQAIVSPVGRSRAGHPVLFAPEMRRELMRARTARSVVEKNPRRVKKVRVSSAAIWKDLEMLAAAPKRTGGGTRKSPGRKQAAKRAVVR